MPDTEKPMPGVGMIGCGYWGRNLVRNFARLGALAAVCDADPAVAEAAAALHGVPARSLDDMLADAAIPAVVIATPAATHAAIARRALAAGKHVYVEKPMALDPAEAETLIAMADAAGRTLMVGHLLRYHPAFVALAELVAKGTLGRLRYIYSNRLNLGRFRREENILWSFAPHDISMILALVGSEPDRISAVGHSYLHRELADTTTTHLSFPGGENAHIFVSWLHPFKEQKLVVIGERGMAVFDDTRDWDAKLLVWAHEVAWRDGRPEAAPADAVPVRLVEGEPLAAECRHFLDCVSTGRVPLTDGREGLKVLRVLAAAERAMTGSAAAALPAGSYPGTTIHPTAVIDPPAAIGAGTRIWHYSHVLKGSRIGRDCVLGQNVAIGPDVVVGARCKIQNNVSIYKGVTLEDGVFCGPSCVFTNVRTPRAEVNRMDEVAPTLVGRGATIGANATIVCGNSLGEYCMVAAGAVVTRDVPPYALVAGVPARRIGWVSEAGERLGRDLVCPRTGQHYQLAGRDRLVPVDSAAGGKPARARKTPAKSTKRKGP